MILLIVDDQSSVVKGIMDGVDWAADGFGRVFAAYNTAEARAILSAHEVDVMLCDIEMPVENGLSLVAWMRRENMNTKCIFLTSHMSFEYAQQALRLGSTDYLVLPAPYPDIRLAVQKAVGQVKSSHASREVYEYGLMMRRQEDTFVEGVLRHYLATGEVGDLRQVQALDRLPSLDMPCHLAIIQVLRQEGGLEQWEPGNLRYAINNILAELLGNYGQSCIGVEMSRGVLCYLVFGGDYTIDMEGLVRQLERLVEVGTQHLNCLLACYTDKAVSLGKVYAEYKTLQARMADNVAMRSGVFYAAGQQPPAAGSLPQTASYGRWRQQLADGYTKAVREESLACLEALAQSGQLTAGVLQQFYQQYVQMLNWVLQNRQPPVQDIFTSREAFEIYHSGSQSMQDMARLINYAMDGLEQLADAGQEEAFNPEQVIRYIHDHLDSDIRRSELAEHFHLNPDYLARVFKKATGLTLKEFIVSEKLAMAKSLLRTTNLPIGMVAVKVGYSSFSHFSKVYQKSTGLTPSEERQAARQQGG